MLEYDNMYNKNFPKMVKNRLTIQIWLKFLTEQKFFFILFSILQ